MDLFDFNREDLMAMPIPDLSALRTSRKTWDIRIDIAHHRYSEELQDISEYKMAGENYYGAMNNPPVAYAIKQLLVRKSVMTSLLLAQFHLDRLSDGKKSLFIKDGWRPVELQKDRYEHNLKMTRKAHPEWSEETLREYMRGWFTQVPEGEKLLLAPPPHTTGGAVDLVIKYTRSDNFVNTGEKGGEKNHPDYYERESGKRVLTVAEKIVQRNRRLLYWLMVGVGLAPSPTEFWHASKGDQMWAEFSDKNKAFYGLIRT